MKMMMVILTTLLFLTALSTEALSEPLHAFNTTASTDTVDAPVLLLKHTSTRSSISDRFGTRIDFQIGDTGGSNSIVNFKAIRDGADNNGKLIIQTRNVNAWNDGLTINYAGNTTLGGDFDLDGKITVKDSLVVVPSVLSDPADSALTFTITSGEPVIGLKASDDDAAEITINTSDQLVLQNASGGVNLAGTKLVNHLQAVEIINAADALNANQSGLLSIYRPLTAKRTATLPTAAAGLNYDFMVADADSLLITTGSGDSLITSAGAAYKTTTSVAGTVKLVAVDATRWIMLYTLGTWTSY